MTSKNGENFKAKTLWPSRIFYVDKGRGGDGGQNTGKKKQNGAMVLQFQSENLAGAFPFLEPPKVKENLFFLFFKKRKEWCLTPNKEWLSFVRAFSKKVCGGLGGRENLPKTKKIEHRG